MKLEGVGKNYKELEVSWIAWMGSNKAETKALSYGVFRKLNQRTMKFALSIVSSADPRLKIC